MLDATPSVSIIILAAGSSTRLGQPKQLLPHHSGRTFLRHAAEEAIASRAESVVVVIGAREAEMRGQLRDLDLRIVENPSWSKGMSTSLRAGLAELEAGAWKAEAALIMLCDQPFVTAATLNEFIDLYQTTNNLIVAAEYNGTIGVPALFPRRYFTELANLIGAAGAKRVLQAHLTNVTRLAFPAGGVDIDTQVDYRKYAGA